MTTQAALHYHLTCNHYPPVPDSMIDPCEQAIDAANGDEWDRLITLPDGVTWRGQTTAPARAIIDGHHLHPFIDDDLEGF